MKRLTTALAAYAALSLTASVFAQNKMGDHSMSSQHMAGSHMPRQEMMMGVAMTGLTSDERKTAMRMISKLSPAQTALMRKRCSMCMADKHTGVDLNTTDDKMGMQHELTGLSKSDQAAMKRIWAKLSPKEMAVGKKMMRNCCAYGMEHGK